MKYIIPLLFLSQILFSQKTQPGQYTELGQVRWYRNLADGALEARRTGKPIFILFQEVPGCSTCQRYGNEVLSHPLMAEAIEDLFIPVCIFNNKGGNDAEALRIFGEPAWNNPVVRIINTELKDLVPRIDGSYHIEAVSAAMMSALKISKQTTPHYLQLLHDAFAAQRHGTEQTTFSMYCFWSGERTFGEADGVVSTRAGYMHGEEVVQVEYDPRITNFEQLLKHAESNQCASNCYTSSTGQIPIAKKILGSSRVAKPGTFRPDKEPKYYLLHSSYAHVPMLPNQASKVNALCAARKPVDAYLSPRQRECHQFMLQHPEKHWPVVIDQDFITSWQACMKVKQS